ncbi:hypothetical protein SLEP1_g20481 [Rubroshorea leprosula]|nr:hypothetical protein SLEP1_g20481 [Rubroshorea leprosula]
MVGGKFTWRRGRVCEKLDRGLASASWKCLFPHAQVRLLPPLSSDHNPLWLTINGRRDKRNRHKKKFCFEEMWLRDASCQEIIHNSWLSVNGAGDWLSLLQKVKACSIGLESWNSQHFGNVQRRLEQCTKRLEALSLCRDPEAACQEEKQILFETEEWLEREERMARNKIQKLLTDQGEWTTNLAELRGLVTGYFAQIFESTRPSNIDVVTSCLCPRVGVRENSYLLHDFTEEELVKALFQMHPSKAPGPDGLTPLFFQKFWSTVKKDVITPCLQYLNLGVAFPQELNLTNIVLIPKCKEPKTMSDLRPISLCNVIYKVLAKTLANRLKQVLPEVISPEQSAFLQTRLITDNFLIAYEVLHFMRARKRRKRGWQAIKLNMSKAFDRVEWPYLEAVMRALGFADRWISLIMGCVSSVQYNILLNGADAGRVIPTRGLRQGDPLSLYLFILCAEGLTAMIRDAEEQKLLHGIKICRQAPTISHLFFADDSFLFLRATETESKSSVIFSSNVPQRTQDAISQILCMSASSQPGRYLGLPAFVGRNRTAVFSSLKSKVWHKVGEWREQPLSRAGREVLIKSVLQALPTYVMSLFLLPQSLCTDLERIMNRYWWGGGMDEHKIHWLEWKKLATSKRDGSLGFRSLHEFNLAMLCKQSWRLLVNPDSLVGRLMKAKYFPRSDLFHAELKPACSQTWRSIWCSITLLRQGCRKLIGDGRTIEIWGDPWLPGITQFCVQSPRPLSCTLHYVADLIDEATHTWKQDLILCTFNPSEAALILSIPLSWTRRNDGWTWNFTRNGVFSVRTGYHRALEMESSRIGPSGSSGSVGGGRLWRIDVPETVRLLIWQAYRGVLPTKDNLHRRRVETDLLCPVCGLEPESILHCFVYCLAARATWLGSPLSLRVSELHVDNFAAFIDGMIPILGREQLEMLCILCWKIWGCRNEVVWHGKHTDPQRIIEHGLGYLREYKQAMISKGRQVGLGQQLGETRWRPPDVSHVKINTDGATSGQQQNFGIGAVARDHDGNVVAAMACKGQGAVVAEIAEACSLRKALQWARGLSFDRIILESDCATIVTAMQHESPPLNSTLGLIISDSKMLMTSFLSCRVQHTRREGNSVAHELAKRAIQAEADECWGADLPELIAQFVIRDKSNI